MENSYLMPRPIRGLFIIIFVAFVLNKTMIRPEVLSWEQFDLLKIFVLSFPNFCEAVMGSMIITALIKMGINAGYLDNAFRRWGIELAILAAGIFVITQELKIHNLGGRNVYDPYDVLFSIIGLSVSYFVLKKYQPLQYSR